MKNKFYIVILILTFSIGAQAQEISKKMQREARADVREGNKLYNQFKFDEAKKLYNKALTINPNYPKAAYNLGNSLYQQNNAKEALSFYQLANKNNKDTFNQAETFHNIGNSYMKQKQYQQAVDAYKNSLKNNSKDDETRYNLALAQELLKQQQNKDKNKNNKDNKDNKNKDKNKDNKDKNKDKDNKKDKNKDNKNNKDKNDKDKKDKNQQQQPRPNQLSQDQIKQMLDALNNEENKTINKMNAEKAKGAKIKQEKDW